MIWTQANAILGDRRPATSPKPKKPVHLFAGLVYCHCGTKMYVLIRTTKYGCQKCHNKIAADDLEAVFADQLRDFVFSPEDIAQHLSQADEEIRTKEEVLQILESERDSVASMSQKVLRAYMADEISMQTYGKQTRPLEERMAQLQEAIPRLQSEIDFRKIQHLSQDEILTEARDLYSRWPSLTFEERREIVETIVERIIIGKGDVEIELSYLPKSYELVTKGPHNSEVALPCCTEIRELPRAAQRV